MILFEECIYDEREHKTLTRDCVLVMCTLCVRVFPSVKTEFCSFVQTKRRKRRKKKQKSFTTTLSTVVQKTIKFKLEPTLSLLLHHISSLLFAQERQREVFCLKFQKQLYHHARLRERERDFSHTSLFSACIFSTLKT